MTAIKEVLTPQTVGGLIPQAVGAVTHETQLNLLIYGDSGAGKTHLAGSADEIPEFRKVLHLDIEGGSMTLRRKFPRVETVRINSWNQLVKIEEDLFQNDCYDFGTVIIDNLTEAQELCKRQVMAEAVEKVGDKREIEPEAPEKRHWGILAERFMVLVRNYRDLPCNFIGTAWAMEVNDNHSKKKWRPQVQGSAKQALPGAFSIVGYLHTELTRDGESVRQFSTRETKDWIAKERDTDLPPDLGNVTMADIMDYIPKGETN